MDSKFKAWLLAQQLYWFFKVKGVKGMPEQAMKATEPFERYGTDPRTRDKYFELMFKYGYTKLEGNLFTIPENIESLKPATPTEYLKQLKAQAQGQPIPEQKTL